MYEQLGKKHCRYVFATLLIIATANNNNSVNSSSSSRNNYNSNNNLWPKFTLPAYTLWQQYWVPCETCVGDCLCIMVLCFCFVHTSGQNVNCKSCLNLYVVFKFSVHFSPYFHLLYVTKCTSFISVAAVS